MTRRRNLERHLRSMAEIRSVMSSMKTLAYMETRKLVRFSEAQQAVVESMENVAGELLSFHPEILPEVADSTTVFLVIGSERGFCGDFNRTLLQHLESAIDAVTLPGATVIAVGTKLHQLLDDLPLPLIRLEGPSVVEEATDVLNRVVEQLLAVQSDKGSISLYGLYHAGENGVVAQRLLPPFQHLQHQPQRFPHPPMLNLTPSAFLVELTDQYLFAALNQMLYASLTEENHQRVAHLDEAVRHLDQESEELRRQSNALRQEEITEEIEIILLNAPVHVGPAAAE
jgi:F-type H+-transporting ATPase subunit gamma